MFGFYDVRGVWGRDIDPGSAELLGAAIRQIVGDTEVLSGMDVRVSSLPLSFHLWKGLGGEVKSLGITTTPMVYFAAWHEGLEALQVTASHNPPEYNGVKFAHADGRDWSHEEIEELSELFGSVSPVGDVKVVLDRTPVTEYLEIYRGWDVPRIYLAFDPSNGAGYQLLPFLKEKFSVKPVNTVPDGTFPGHPPDPLLPESQKDVKREAREWGMLLDGDGDRLALFYRHEYIPSDVIVAVLADRGLAGKKVALEVMMPLALEEYLRDRGVKVVRTPTGRVLIKERAREERFDMFAEYSGHFGFKEFNYIDDPLFVFFKLVGSGRGVDTSYRPPARSPVMSLRLAKEEVDALVSALDAQEVHTLDGYDIRTEEGRVLLRPSKTEPGLWRIVVEATDNVSLENLMKKVEVILRGAPENRR